MKCDQHLLRWLITPVDVAGDVGKYTSIALDSNEQPHISYYDSGSFDLMYAYYGPTGIGR